MKQTAVEWLYLQLIKNPKTPWNDILQQAKQMEKEQIIEAFEHVDFNLDDGLHYYNETFKLENNKTVIFLED
jgi:hypothetical protein